MRLLAFAVLWLVSPATAQSEFTYGQLKNLETREAARLLLGASGEQMVEHRIFVNEGGFSVGPKGRLESVAFAGPPQYRTDGTCEAKGSQLYFSPVGVSRQPDPAVRLHSSDVRNLWGILPPGANDCAALGPVLGRDGTGGAYFRAQGVEGQLGARTVSAAVAMLRGFLVKPARGGPIRCSIDFEGPDARQAACEAGRAAEILDLRRISLLRVGHCQHARRPANGEATCASFQFPDPSETSGWGVYLQIVFVTDLPEGATLTESAKVTRVRIDKVRWVA